MKDEINSKKFFSGPVIGLSAVLVLAVVMLAGASYAYYKVTLVAEGGVTLKSGALEITLDDVDSNEILLDNTQPVTDEEGMSYKPYTFVLENTGNIDGDYVLYLDDVSIDGARMNDKYVKYNLSKDGEEKNIKLLAMNDSFKTEEGVTSRAIGKGTIKAGESFRYTLNLWVADTADNGVMNTEFKVKLRVGAAQVIPKACSVTKGDGNTIGDEVVCGSENFYVIASDESSLTMLAQNNLDLTSGLQKKDATSTFFANDAYWGSTTLTYPTYVYNEASNLYTYVTKYNTYLKDLGISSSSSTLMSYEQAVRLGCNVTTLSCTSAPEFLSSTSYFLGSASDSDGHIYAIASNKGFGPVSITDNFGIRPVVVISKSEL